MHQAKLDCPHCSTRGAAFDCLGAYALGAEVHSFLRCGICDRAIVGVFADDPAWTRARDEYESFARVVLTGEPELLTTWPRQSAPDAPAGTPKNVAGYYLQGLANLALSHYDAAGGMFRKTLDTALKEIDPGAKGSLQERIDKLPPDLGITPTMRRWAHEIRRLGNDAVHDEDPFDGSEASDLQRFTDLFLNYAFTLPARIEMRFRKEPAQ